MSAATSESTFQKDAGVIERAKKALPWALVAAGTAVAATKSKEGAAIYALASVMSLGYIENSFGFQSKVRDMLDGNERVSFHKSNSKYFHLALNAAFSAATIVFIAPVITQCFARYSSYTALSSFAAFTIAYGAFCNVPTQLIFNNNAAKKTEFDADQAFKCFAHPAAFYTCAIAIPSVLSPYVGGMPSRFIGGALLCLASGILAQPKESSFSDRMNKVFKDETLVKKAVVGGVLQSIFGISSTTPDISSFSAVAAKSFMRNSIPRSLGCI